MGYNAFIYDPRSIGDSGGLPKNQIDPLQQAEDLSGKYSSQLESEGSEQLSIDIITSIASLPSVDESRIILWGMSFGGTVSACATAVDRRVKALVMVCPISRFFQPNKRYKAFAQLTKDKQSQLRGNEPFTLPLVNSKGENPLKMAGSK